MSTIYDHDPNLKASFVSLFLEHKGIRNSEEFQLRMMSDDIINYHYWNLFDCKLRDYVAGDLRSLYLLMACVRRFYAATPHAETYMTASFKCAHSEILTNELYELMPAFTYAQQQVQNLINIYNNHDHTNTQH